MRFEYERVTSRNILRRVAENEALTGKRITTVWLTHAEWREFVMHEGAKLYHETRPEYAMWRLTRPPKMLAPTLTHGYVDIEETIITVRPEL